MNNIFVADAHCDTVSEMYNPFLPDGKKTHFNFPDIKAYKSYFQIFAVWSDPKIGYKNLRKNFLKITENFNLKKGDLHVVRKKKDVLNLCKTNAMLALEGGDIIDDDLNYIDFLYCHGVRCLTLTWNYSNKIGGAAADNCSNFSLTDFGKKVIKKLNEKHMIVDLSHANEHTFFDACAESTAPICATHSNARAVCDNVRNLSDEQIDALIKTGGFMGINFYPAFLSNAPTASLSDIFFNIEHVLSRGGEDIVGLGSDFDGITSLPQGIGGCGDVYKIADGLLRLNYSEQTVKKIMGENLISYISKILA